MRTDAKHPARSGFSYLPASPSLVQDKQTHSWTIRGAVVLTTCSYRNTQTTPHIRLGISMWSDTKWANKQQMQSVLSVPLIVTEQSFATSLLIRFSCIETCSGIGQTLMEWVKIFPAISPSACTAFFVPCRQRIHTPIHSSCKSINSG